MTLINNLKTNKFIKKCSYYGIVIFLFLYIFSIPTFSARPVWYLISYVLMACFAGFVLIYTILYTKFTFNRWLLIPIAFVIFAFIGTCLHSQNFIGKTGAIGWSTLVLMLVTLLFFYYGFIAINNRRLCLYILIFAFLLFAFIFAYHYRDKIIGLKLGSDRIDTYFDNQNTIGFYFAIGFTLSLYISVFSQKKIELLFLIPSLIFFGLGFFTGSRSFFISVVAATIIISYLKLRKHKIIFLILLGCFIGLFIILLNVPQLAFLKDQFNRTIYTLFGIGNSKVDTSTVQRTIWPGYAFYLGGKNLLFGYGVNGFSIYSGVGTYAHNNFAEVLCNFGIIGFLLFYSCYIFPFILSLKKRTDDAYLVPVLFGMYFFRHFFGVSYYAKEAYLIIALLMYLTADYKLPRYGTLSSKLNSDKFLEAKI